jgi:hypothetical protein
MANKAPVNDNVNEVIRKAAKDNGDNSYSLHTYFDDFSSDAFGRFRVSDPSERLSVEFLYGKQSEYFDEVTNNGTVTHNANTSDLTLSISDANSGTYAKMKSYPVPYTPGNSQLVEMTGVLNLAGITGGTYECFLRSKISGSVVDLTTVERSSWDNFSEDSERDFTKSQIFAIDFQSLRVGTIRFWIFKNGAPKLVTAINNDNVRDSGYWQSPNLPVSYQITNDGNYTYLEMCYGDDNNAIGFRYKVAANANATMKQICCTVKSEGGLPIPRIEGLLRVADRGVTTKTVSTTLVPLISIKPSSTFLSKPNLGLYLIRKFSVQTDEAIKIVLVHNPTLTGASWINVNTNESGMQYDISATALTGGHNADSEYIYAASAAPASSRVTTADSGLLRRVYLWNRENGESGIFTVAAIRTGATDASVLASIQWEEIL